MLRFIINAVITAVVFCFVFPEVNSGIQFHGPFWPEGVIYAGIFSIVASLVGLAIGAGATLFTVATRGVGLLLVVPALLLGFWLIPAIQLEVFAHYFPAHFTVASWGSAVWGGLILMLVNALTANWTHHSNSVKTND